MVGPEAPHQHNRVQPDEGDSRRRRVPQQLCAAPHQSERAEACQGDDQLDRPKRAGHPQRHERVAEQRERGAVGAEQVAPVAQREAGVGVAAERRNDRVRVQALQDAHPSVVDVVEDVRVLQRRREQEHDVDRQQRGDGPPSPKPPGEPEGDHIEDVHRDHQPAQQPGKPVLIACQPRKQAVQGSRHPGGEVAAGTRRGEGAGPLRGHQHDQDAAGRQSGQRDRRQQRRGRARQRGEGSAASSA